MTLSRVSGAPSALTLLLCGWLAFAPRAGAQTSLIIYNDGRVLIRRYLPVAVPRGTSQHTVELDQFDPGSLVALDPGLSIIEVDYPRTLDEATLYRGSLGRRLIFHVPRSGDTVSALVAGDDPLRFELPDGRVTLTAPGIPLFPKTLVGAARPTTLVVESDRPRPRLALGMMTSGTTWNAEYSVVLGGLTGEVSGNVAIHSLEVRADSAEISLLEGAVARASAFQRDLQRRDQLRLEELVVTGVAQSAGGPMAPVGVGGFRLYAIPGRHSLSPGRTMVARLFAPVQVPVARVNQVSSPGIQVGAPFQDLPVEVHYRIARPREAALGAQALPPGVARVYSRTDGTLILVGEAAVARADPGQLLDLTAGSTVTLTARRSPVQATLVNDSVVGADGRTSVSGSGQIADVEIRFANVADTVAMVELTERIPPPFRLISSSVPAEPLGGGQIRFRLDVPARGERVLRYRVRISP